ncbi:esterase [Pedobacter sp. UBA4863]|uniref:alpha/beta hydrolase family esterase n=1 Tax=Pedobacter sp. UBA4863 TaxID=1947060 RepID=UPI0025FD6E92|nr:esterase [Pedobacter sp. UBA4863]
MNPNHTLKAKLWTLLMFISFGSSLAQELPQTLTWTINGETRKALVYIPATAKTKPTPIIFTFHGHGGTMQKMYSTRGFEKLWPQAIFICPQGLNTVGMLTDPEGKKSGWVMTDQTNENRDLQFFDAMLKTLRADYKIDNSRIYATGHSNGGGFTYLLWATRANEFAAFAPTGTSGGKLIAKLNTPKPGFHLMGKNDPLVKPEWQERTYNKILRVNGCTENGVKLDSNITAYTGKDGNDFQLFIYPGGHEYPKNANQPIIDFFKKYTKNKL